MNNTIKPDLISLVSSSIIRLYNLIQTPNGEAKKMYDVFVATHLHNSLYQFPTLKTVSTIPTGYKFIYSLPAGLTLKEFIERKMYFETHTNGQLEIYPPVNRYITILVHHMEFPDNFEYKFNPPANMLVPLPIGILPDGTELYTDLAELPHILVGGMTGFGKTSLLKGWTVALKTQNVEVCVIDRKRMDFPPLSRFLNVAESEEESLSLIKTLLKENERRQTIIRELGAYKYSDLKNPPFPYLVVIIDEAAEIATPETYEGIDSLARLGRASGISLILATQKASAKLWNQTFSNTRDMMSGRLSFYCADYMMSQIILGKGNTNACRLPMTKGRAVSVMGERERIVQSMYLEPSKAIEILESLNSKPYFEDIQPVTIEKKKRGRKKVEK